MCATCLAAVDHNIESDKLNSTYLFCTNCSFATESYCSLIHSLFSSALRLPLHPSLSISLSLILSLSLSLEGSAQCSSQPWLNYLLAASAAEPLRLRSSPFGPHQPSRPDRWPCKEHCCYARPDHGTNGLFRHCGIRGTRHGHRIQGPPAVRRVSCPAGTGEQDALQST